jgi:hypothetical protein
VLRRPLETAEELWSHLGLTKPHAWTADPDLIRRMATGQACYISHGSATFVQVAGPRPSPLTLLPAPVSAQSAEPPARPPAPRREAAGPPPGQPSARFDDHFGPGAAP